MSGGGHVWRVCPGGGMSKGVGMSKGWVFPRGGMSKGVGMSKGWVCPRGGMSKGWVCPGVGWVCPGVGMCRGWVGMCRGWVGMCKGWVGMCRGVYPAGGYPHPPPLTPSGGHLDAFTLADLMLNVW